MSVDIAVVASFVIESAVTLPRIPVLGESVKAEQYYMAPGGKGTNQAVTASRQGKNVGIVAKVGNDMYGKMAFDLYSREGIKTDGVFMTDEEKTAIGLVYIHPTGDNCCAIYMGANKKLGYDEVSSVMNNYMPAKIVTAQLESADAAILSAFEIAKKNNAMTLLNPAPARKVDDRILALTDIMTPNESEAKLLAGFDPGDQDINMEMVSEKLISFGIKALVITLGAKGCIVMEKGSEPVRISPFKVNAKDTLGAGDCFSGSLAVALSEDKSLIEAAEWASVAAALSTMGNGGIAPLPSREQVEAHYQLYKMQDK